MQSLPQILQDTLMYILLVKLVQAQPHHSGKGTHITIEFLNGHKASVTTNTCHTDVNDTYEILATTMHPDYEGESSEVCHLTLEELLKILKYISSLKENI